MGKQSQVSWGGRFSAGTAELMLCFSESVSFDHRLAPFDIQGSQAHAAMLAHVGLITRREREAIHRGLEAILKEVKKGKFKWSQQLEDVHMNIEQALTKRVPAAAKLHTARSRNDQVATDMRLYFKAACAEVIASLQTAQRAILAVVEKDGSVLLPGYTHLQRAQPVPRTLTSFMLFSLEHCIENIADDQDAEEDPHRDQTERADGFQGNGPRKQEGDFQIKQDEQNGDEVITHVEAHARVLEGLESALVRRVLLRVRPLGAEKEAERLGRDADAHRSGPV